MIEVCANGLSLHGWEAVGFAQARLASRSFQLVVFQASLELLIAARQASGVRHNKLDRLRSSLEQAIAGKLPWPARR
jgi:hypothetical protein